MNSKVISILILCAAIKSTASDYHEAVNRSTNCYPNRVYKKDDVTCFCDTDGRWPHMNCSLVFGARAQMTCKPESYVQVGCNICRCTKTGNIDVEFCTKHICIEGARAAVHRRSNSVNGRCEPNHWYALSACRFCYCINKNHLLCSRGTSNPSKLLLGKYNLADCGLNFLNDINKISTENPLRMIKKDYGGSKVIQIETQQLKTTPTVEVSKSDINQKEDKKDKDLDEEINMESDDNDDLSNISGNSRMENHDRTTKDKPIGRIAANTMIPFEKEEDNSEDGSIEVESDRRDSDRESVNNEDEPDNPDTTVEVVDEPVTGNKKMQDTQSNYVQQKPNRSLLNVNIPAVLGKVFNFGRRFMVSLDNSNCVPGSTVAVKCNTCFCLKNGKMLCTKKLCE